MGWRGLSVVARELSLIEMGELVKLNICIKIGDSLGPERQPDAATGAPEAAEDAPAVDEGNQGVLAPVHEPPPPPAAARTLPQRMARLEEDVHEIRRALAEQHEVIGAMARDSLDSPYGPPRRGRQRTGEASTSTTQQDQQQPDP
ncbi:hypothetical protein Tco_1351434 [Tanacetum coccineum]